MFLRPITIVSLACSVLTAVGLALAAGGTSQVAAEGQPAHVSPGWPQGTGELVNHPLRTTGWNSWFSEWPNDVNHYAYAVKNTDDLNRLIEKLAAIQADVLQVRLCHLKEPRGLGWVTKLPEGNGIPVLFSIGDQSRIDEWYRTVRKPFGVIEFTEAPVAVPPTLTIFVPHEAVSLVDLTIPPEIEVIAGYVPMVFHKSNTLNEERARQAPAAELPAAAEANVELPPAEQAAVDNIRVFLKARASVPNP